MLYVTVTKSHISYTYHIEKIKKILKQEYYITYSLYVDLIDNI